jgi:RNA polymerase sigma-70 factor (ECF subfamily)
MNGLRELNDANIQEENELVRRLLEGDGDAFTELVGLYQRRIFNLAFGFFQDRDDAMEIVQETFIRLYEKMDRFDRSGGQASFKNWVYRIAYNLCIDYYRKYKKKKVDDKELFEFYENRDRETTGPEDAIDRVHFKHTLEKCVMRLSKRQRMVFMLKHHSQLKHHEISDILDVSVGTVKSLYHRAVKTLQKRLVRWEVEK